MDMFRECGWAAFVVLLLAVVSIVVAVAALVVALLKPKLGSIAGVAAFAIALSAPAMGAVGWYQGRAVTDAAIAGASVDPAQRERIREVGHAEAGQCLTLGASLGALPVLLGLVTLGLGLARRPKPD